MHIFFIFGAGQEQDCWRWKVKLSCHSANQYQQALRLPTSPPILKRNMLEWPVLKSTQPYILGRNLNRKQQKKDFIVLSKLSTSHKTLSMLVKSIWHHFPQPITTSTMSTYRSKVLHLSHQFWISSNHNNQSNSSLMQNINCIKGLMTGLTHHKVYNVLVDSNNQFWFGMDLE